MKRVWNFLFFFTFFDSMQHRNLALVGNTYGNDTNNIMWYMFCCSMYINMYKHIYNILLYNHIFIYWKFFLFCMKIIKIQAVHIREKEQHMKRIGDRNRRRRRWTIFYSSAFRFKIFPHFHNFMGFGKLKKMKKKKFSSSFYYFNF